MSDVIVASYLFEQEDGLSPIAYALPNQDGKIAAVNKIPIMKIGINAWPLEKRKDVCRLLMTKFAN